MAPKWVWGCASIRSRPGKPNQRAGHNGKFMNVTLFCVNSGVVPEGKQARNSHLELFFLSRMPLRKVHELTFFLVGFAGATPDSTRRLLGARCFQNGHFGRISSLLCIFHSASEPRRAYASARRVSTSRASAKCI